MQVQRWRIGFQRVWDWLTHPRSTEVDWARQEYMTNVVLVLLCVVSMPLTILFAVGGIMGLFPLDSFGITLIMTIMFGLGWWLSRHGHWRIAGHIPPWLVFLTAMYGNLIGGTSAPATILYLLAIVLTATLKGKGIQWLTLVLGVLSYAGIGWAHLSGLLPPPRTAEEMFGNRLVIIIGVYASTAFLLWLLINRFQSSIVELYQVNKQLAQEIAERQRAQEVEREQRVLAEALRDTLTALNSTLDLQKILEAILVNIRRVVPHDAVNVMLIDPTSGLAEVVRCRGYNQISSELEQLVLALRFPVSEVITLREMAQTGAPFAIADTRGYPGWIDGPATHWVRSYAGAPIRVENETVGFINLDSATPGFFTPLHAERLRIFADQAAIAIRNARLYEQAQHEIAERRLVERALKQEQALFVLGPVVVFKWGARAGWPVEYVSPNIEQFGYHPQDFLSGRITYRDFIHPEDRERIIPNDTGRITLQHQLTGLVFSTQEYRVLCADGSERWVYDYTRAVYDEQKNLLYYHGYILDITERKQAQEAQERLQTQLFQAQKMEAIGRLAGGIAHDFNNNLTTILGYAELLIAELQETPYLEDLQEITRAATRSATLTRQLLSFSRKQAIQPAAINLGDLVSGMQDMLRRLIGENITLNVLAGPSPTPVRVDPGQIEQVIINLVLNARDAIAQKATNTTGPFEGILTIETANVTLEESDAERHFEIVPGEYVLLSVSDNGIGMDQETQQHLFEPFFTTKAPGKGTGLGLASVYGSIRQNGGLIWVYSEPGVGTTFKIYLPRLLQSTGDIHTETPDSLRGGAETILLVEDEPAVRTFARRALEQYGYRVLEAQNAIEALSLFQSSPTAIDLLITDLILPGALNGHSLVEQLMRLHPELRAIYTSGYTDNTIVHHGVLEPGVHFLQKPFRAEDLVRMVRRVLDLPADPNAHGG